MTFVVTLYFLVSFACDLVTDHRADINRVLDQLQTAGTITATQYTDVTEFLDGLSVICEIFRIMVFGLSP